MSPDQPVHNRFDAALKRLMPTFVVMRRLLFVCLVSGVLAAFAGFELLSSVRATASASATAICVAVRVQEAAADREEALARAPGVIKAGTADLHRRSAMRLNHFAALLRGTGVGCPPRTSSPTLP